MCIIIKVDQVTNILTVQKEKNSHFPQSRASTGPIRKFLSQANELFMYKRANRRIGNDFNKDNWNRRGTPSPAGIHWNRICRFFPWIFDFGQFNGCQRSFAELHDRSVDNRRLRKSAIPALQDISQWVRGNACNGNDECIPQV